MRAGYRVSSFISTEKDYQIFLYIAREFFDKGLIDKPSVGLLAKYSTIYMANLYQEAIRERTIKQKEEARKENLQNIEGSKKLNDQPKGVERASSREQKEDWT